MFANKQRHSHRAAVSPSACRSILRVGLGSVCALALMLGPVRVAMAQDDSTRNSTVDSTPKKDSVPMGVKPKTDPKKADPVKTTAPKKTTAKSGGRGKMTMTKRIALVFPVDTPNASAGQLSDVVTDVEKARLSASGQFGAISFLTSLPSIRRAVGEQSLTSTDVQPPFASRTKAQKLTSTAGYDLGVISSMDQYEYNADKQNVSIVLSVQMYDFSQDPPKSYTAGDSVTTAPKSAKNAADTTAAEEAVRNLTEKLMTTVLNSAAGAKSPSPAPAGKATPAKTKAAKK